MVSVKEKSAFKRSRKPELAAAPQTQVQFGTEQKGRVLHVSAQDMHVLFKKIIVGVMVALVPVLVIVGGLLLTRLVR